MIHVQGALRLDRPLRVQLVFSFARNAVTTAGSHAALPAAQSVVPRRTRHVAPAHAPYSHHITQLTSRSVVVRVVWGLFGADHLGWVHA